jgi:hypothetical protein
VQLTKQLAHRQSVPYAEDSVVFAAYAQRVELDTRRHRPHDIDRLARDGDTVTARGKLGDVAIGKQTVTVRAMVGQQARRMDDKDSVGRAT